MSDKKNSCSKNGLTRKKDNNYNNYFESEINYYDNTDCEIEQNPNTYSNYYYPNYNILTHITKEVNVIRSYKLVKINSLIESCTNPFEKLYFNVCKEILKIYENSKSKYKSNLIEIFGNELKIENFNRPLFYNKFSKLMGMSLPWFSELMINYNKYINGEKKYIPIIRFSNLFEKIEPSLSKIFGGETAHNIIYNHLGERGYRPVMFYAMYSLLCSKTNRIYKIFEFSKIFFNDKYKVGTLLQTPNPIKKDLNLLWKLEYLISKMKTNVTLNFNPEPHIIKEIIFESRKLLRVEIIRQTSRISPIAINMILNSLYALSDIGGFYSFKRLSEVVPDRAANNYLGSRIFSYELNPPDWFARNLLKVLTREGVKSNHMAVQWTELYLENRGLKYLDFEFYLNKFSQLSGKRVSDKSILSQDEIIIALTIVYGLTGRRSWLTGELISFDDALLHHILHDEYGFTLYGLDHENKFNFFACVNGNSENRYLENENIRQDWENTFLYMWQKFRENDYISATDHWNPEYQKAFLKERRSMRYLDFWIETYNKNTKKT